MEVVDDITIDFLEETIEILASALQRLKKLQARAERDLSIDYKNRQTILKMAKEIHELKLGVVG